MRRSMAPSVVLTGYAADPRLVHLQVMGIRTTVVLGGQGFGRLSSVTIAAATTRLHTTWGLQLLANPFKRITFQIDHDQRWFLQLFGYIVGMPVESAIRGEITGVEVLREILVEPFWRKMQGHHSTSTCHL